MLTAEGVRTGFKLRFAFADNPFFTNKVRTPVLIASMCLSCSPLQVPRSRLGGQCGQGSRPLVPRLQAGQPHALYLCAPCMGGASAAVPTAHPPTPPPALRLAVY